MPARPGGRRAAAPGEPRRHRGDGSAADPGRPTGSAGRHARPGSGADRSGGQFPLAGWRPAGGVARACRPESGGWVGHRPAKDLPAVRQAVEDRCSRGWSAGQVLQRRLPDGCASRTAPDSTGDRRSLTPITPRRTGPMSVDGRGLASSRRTAVVRQLAAVLRATLLWQLGVRIESFPLHLRQGFVTPPSRRGRVLPLGGAEPIPRGCPG